MESKNDLTLNITTTEKPNGFMVLVGKEKGSGSFEYMIGSEKEAQELGEKMKEKYELVFKQQMIITVKPCLLKKCDNNHCEKLTEENYCLRCEDLMFDAQLDARADEQEREMELESEVYCNDY